MDIHLQNYTKSNDMNYKELVDAMAATLNLPKTETDRLLETTVSIIFEQLTEGGNVVLHGFGNFEVRKKEERISVHPVTRVRTLVPPKLTVNFKQSGTLKDKLKSVSH